MIRRAQAEALLKLAEALEECERNGVRIEFPHTACDSGYIVAGNEEIGLDDFRGFEIRMAITKLYPKSEDSE